MFMPPASCLEPGWAAVHVLCPTSPSISPGWEFLPRRYLHRPAWHSCSRDQPLLLPGRDLSFPAPAVGELLRLRNLHGGRLRHRPLPNAKPEQSAVSDHQTGSYRVV